MKATVLETQLGTQLLAEYQRGDRLVALIQHIDACVECGATTYLECTYAQMLMAGFQPGDMPADMMRRPDSLPPDVMA